MSRPTEIVNGKWQFKTKARGQHKPGQMNATEAEYSQLLENRVMIGEYECFWFEGITLKLAKDCRYTPDFVVMRRDGLIEFHEVKGYWQDDAKVKIRVAAQLYPFRFIAVKKIPKKDGGGWSEEEF